MKKRILSAAILVVVVLLLTGNAVFWASKKEGFHVDEMFSYEQIGNTEYSKPEFDRPDEPCQNTWHDHSYYEDYLNISDDEAKDFSSFYSSASRNTAHPPMYLTLFGIYTSVFFRNDFTKWSGITFNIIFYILTLIVLYDLAMQLLKNRKLAILTVFLYGASSGAVSTVVFIRMYMMLTFFTVIFADVNMHLLKRIINEKVSFKKRMPWYMATALLIIFGALSQYYFIVFAFFMCLSIWLMLLASKRYRLLAEYTVTCIAGLTVYLCVWSKIFRDLFSGYRGTEATSNLRSTNDRFIVHVANYISEIERELTGGMGVYILLVVTAMIAIPLIKREKPHINLRNDSGFDFEYITSAKDVANSDGEYKNTLISREWTMFTLLAISTILSFLMISKIAPVLPFDTFKAVRYVINLLPLFAVGIVFLINKLLSKYYNDKRIKLTVWLALACVGASCCLNSEVDYLYKGTDEQLKILEAYSDDRAFFISDLNYLVSNMNVYFTKNKAVYQTTRKNIPTLSDVFEGLDEKEFIVYISNDISEPEAAFIQLKEELGCEKSYYLFKTVGRHTADVYLISFE